MCVKVRRPLVGVGSVFLHMGPGPSSGYLLGHLTGPWVSALLWVSPKDSGGEGQ